MAAHDLDLAAEEPVDDEKPPVVDVRLDRAGGVPFARGEAAHARDGLPASTLEPILTHLLGQVRVRVDHADDLAHASRHGRVLAEATGDVRARTYAPIRGGVHPGAPRPTVLEVVWALADTST